LGGRYVGQFEALLDVDGFAGLYFLAEEAVLAGVADDLVGDHDLMVLLLLYFEEVLLGVLAAQALHCAAEEGAVGLLSAVFAGVGRGVV
jgi:hypothetical protein